MTTPNTFKSGFVKKPEKVISEMEKNYRTIRETIIVPKSPCRKRKQAIGKARIECDDWVNGILNKCTNGLVKKQVLKEVELLQIKATEEIKKDLKISELTPDDLVERMLVLNHQQIESNKIIGHIEGKSIYMHRGEHNNNCAKVLDVDFYVRGFEILC